MDWKLGGQIQQLREILTKGQANRALETCEALIQKHPAEPLLHELAADCAAAAGRPVRAAEALETAIRLAPHKGAPHIALARLLRSTRQITEAEQHLKIATQKEPDSFAAWHQLGLLLLKEKRLSEAAQCGKKATELSKKNPAGWELRASVAQRNGDLSEAIKLIRRGIELVPDAARLHYSLGQLLREDCQFDKATKAYAKAERLGFLTPDLFRNQSEAHLDAGDVHQAQSCLIRGIRKFPDHPLLHKQNALLKAETNPKHDPLKELIAACHRHPKVAALWQICVELLKRLERKEEASALLEEAGNSGCPSTEAIMVLRAQEAAERGSPEKATHLFEGILRASPESLGARLAFGTFLLERGEYGRAAEQFRTVLKASAHDQLALCYLATTLDLAGDEEASDLLDYESMVFRIPIQTPPAFKNRQAYFDALQSTLEALHLGKAYQPIEQSLRTGTQTSGFLFRLRDPVIRSLEDSIREAVAKTLSTFPSSKSHPFWGRKKGHCVDDFTFSGAWSVRLSESGYHKNHVHPQGWISGVLHVALPESEAGLKSDVGALMLGAPLEDLGLPAEAKRAIEPEVGTLVLFPSYMWHGTAPFRTSKSRLSVAFDIVPKGD